MNWVNTPSRKHWVGTPSHSQPSANPHNNNLDTIKQEMGSPRVRPWAAPGLGSALGPQASPKSFPAAPAGIDYLEYLLLLTVDLGLKRPGLGRSGLGPAWAQARLGPGPSFGLGLGLGGLGPAWAHAWLGPAPGLGRGGLKWARGNPGGQQRPQIVKTT